MDSKVNAMPFCGRRRVHAGGTIRSHREFQVLIAPVEKVVGEEVCANPQLGHAPKVRLLGHLAVLQGVTVIRSRIAGQRGFEGSDGHFCRLVPVGVDVQVHTLGVVGVDYLFQRLRRQIPRPLRTTIVIA